MSMVNYNGVRVLNIVKLHILLWAAYILGCTNLAHGFRYQYDNQQHEKFINDGGVYGNLAPIHNSQDYHRLLTRTKKINSVYNPKEHEDYAFAVPYKTVEEANIVSGKYKDPEPIYDPKLADKLYSDDNALFHHNLEKYRFNKHNAPPNNYKDSSYSGGERYKRNAEPIEKEHGLKHRYGAIYNTAIQKYGRRTMVEIHKATKLFSNPIFQDRLMDLIEKISSNSRFKSSMAKLLLSHIDVSKSGLSDTHMSSEDSTYDKNEEEDSANEDTVEEEEEEVDAEMTINGNEETGRLESIQHNDEI